MEDSNLTINTSVGSWPVEAIRPKSEFPSATSDFGILRSAGFVLFKAMGLQMLPGCSASFPCTKFFLWVGISFGFLRLPSRLSRGFRRLDRKGLAESRLLEVPLRRSRERTVWGKVKRGTRQHPPPPPKKNEEGQITVFFNKNDLKNQKNKNNKIDSPPPPTPKPEGAKKDLRGHGHGLPHGGSAQLNSAKGSLNRLRRGKRRGHGATLAGKSE